jgi:hypothetical protein
MDIAPGDPPGPTFPAGTVYIVTGDMKDEDYPISVTEWDLARASVVACVKLPISTHEVHPWILRVGDQLRVLVSGAESVSYFQLTKDLQVEHTEHWVGDVQRIAAFSADPTLTAVLYAGNAANVSRGEYGGLLATFDGSGKHLATRIVRRQGEKNGLDLVINRRVVVLDGQVFMVVCKYGTGIEMLALSPDLRIEKRVLVSHEVVGNVELDAIDGQLEVVVGDPERRATAYSAALERLGPVTAPGDASSALKLGDEEVWRCSDEGLSWLAWAAGSDDPCSASRSLIPTPPSQIRPMLP